MRKLLLFRVGGRPFGIALHKVKSVYRESGLPATAADGGIRGIRMQDGREIPWYDLGRIFDGNGGAGEGGRSVIIASARGRLMALAVDRAERVVAAAPERIQALPPVFGEKALRHFPLVMRHEDAVAPLFYPEGLLGLDVSKDELARDGLAPGVSEKPAGPTVRREAADRKEGPGKADEDARDIEKALADLILNDATRDKIMNRLTDLTEELVNQKVMKVKETLGRKGKPS